MKAMLDDDREETLDALRDLTSWIEMGGFLPDVPRLLYHLAEHYTGQKI
jgi:hypothetical protein